MDSIIEPDLEKYFHFLSNDYGFKKMAEYSYTREVFNDYLKDGILIKFIYDGTLRVNITKIKDYNQSYYFSARNFKKIIRLNQEITKEKFHKIYNEEGHFKEQAELISDTFKNNPELLRGNLFKLSSFYQLTKINLAGSK